MNTLLVKKPRHTCDPQRELRFRSYPLKTLYLCDCGRFWQYKHLPSGGYQPPRWVPIAKWRAHLRVWFWRRWNP